MPQDKNVFGGNQQHFLYTPMSEDEQEVLQRLIEAGDLKIVVGDWGYVEKPTRIHFSDKRISLEFRMTFDKSELAVPLYYLDLRLETGSGMVLFEERQPTLMDNKPILVDSSTFLDLAWDIGIHKMSPEVVRAVKPYARGLTSRVDNMSLNSAEQKILNVVQQGEAKARQVTLGDAEKATRMADPNDPSLK
jgi:hypothetical protein